jgi:glycosyltransferase involved in cell wall biosynthesis
MKVAVLMSTWQGERYVEEQLHSILRQLPADGQVIVRDDGSTDRGVERIEAMRDPRITILRGPNIGFARSFFTLLDAAPADADVILFSDQDDVWLPDKVARAIAHLAPLGDVPALYCSRLRLVDAGLRPLGESPAWPRPPSFRNALTQNIATGCTCAINRAALPLARRYGDLSLVHFHDWWLYLVFSAFGKVVVDPQPTILYRQHGANAIGTGSGLGRHLSTLRFIRKTNWLDVMYRQVANFRAVHGASLAPLDRQLLDRYFERRRAAMLRLAFAPVGFRQTLVDELLFRGLLLVNLLRKAVRTG